MEPETMASTFSSTKYNGNTIEHIKNPKNDRNINQWVYEIQRFVYRQFNMVIFWLKCKLQSLKYNSA